ncbi:MAG TPA: hypothetical protein VMM38_01220 [Aridibacter sp.]|nr:hypothetical protein [Aridibacter sp.]
MSLPLSHAELLRAVQSQSFINDGIPDRIEDNLYYFRIRLAFLHSPHRQVNKFIDDDALRRGWTLSPSETVFVVSREVLTIPSDIRVALSAARSLAEEGVTLVGNREIEPYFNGKVLLGLYNESSVPFAIDARMRYAAALFENILGKELNSDVRR